MKNFLFFAFATLAFAFVESDVDVESVCPTSAKISTDNQWECGSIYEISFLDGCPRIKGKEILLSVPLMEAIQTIRMDDNTAYGDFVIGYKYIEDEDLYVANLLDEFKEL